MVKSKRYTLRLKRKREGKTNYKKRMSLLKSDKVRLVIRKSLKNISLQIVESKNAQDKVILSSHSKELRNLGWKGNLGNIPSSYLTGLLFGKKALKNKIKEAILDIGLQKSVEKSRIYSALKGCIDSGLNIPHNKKIFPGEERIKGEHIKKEKEFEEVKKKIENG